MKRCLKKLFVAPEILEQLFKGGCFQVYHPGLPKGSKIKSLGYNGCGNSLFAVFEHPTFDAVDDGCEVPTLRGHIVIKELSREQKAPVVESNWLWELGVGLIGALFGVILIKLIEWSAGA